jgi:SusD family.
MKKKNLLYIAIGLALISTGCDDFLDVMPDNRTELNSERTITTLLVSAYPANTDAMLLEISSDNAMDNGSRFPTGSREYEQAYLWQVITGNDNDSPYSFWEGCYKAIAAANLALEAIDKMGNPDNLQAQRGEALMCRAYGHFVLANMFCLSYDPSKAATDMGIPYIDAPITTLNPDYDRGNMKELYEKISADIEAGLPLIDDNMYTVPKYHFNQAAAYAFAARFNLYYHKYDKVIDYASVVLGNDPDRMMRNWAAMNSAAANYTVRTDMYISDKEPANLLLLPVTSILGYIIGPYKGIGERYGHSDDIFSKETAGAAGIWGTSSSLLYAARAVWGFTEKNAIAKVGGYFQYTDKVNRIGYAKNVIVSFSADETLLCRAEAYALRNEAGDMDKATADINTWVKSHTTNKLVSTTSSIASFYNGLAYSVGTTERTQKKRLHPRGFTVMAGEQEDIIHCILHLRRIETIYEGLRWHDIKRYGIEIAHNREGFSVDSLKVNDPRRAFQLPQDVISAGLTANPR